MVKTALIAGGALWERVRAIDALDPAALDEVIFACARTKLDVVAADERDSGRRQVLNLGHTVGHAIEAASGYARYRHGEAVGLGLLATLRLSGATSCATEVDGAARAATGCRPSSPRESMSSEVLAAIERDKKRTADGVGFVPARAARASRGRARAIEPDRVRAAVEELKQRR